MNRFSSPALLRRWSPLSFVLVAACSGSDGAGLLDSGNPGDDASTGNDAAVQQDAGTNDATTPQDVNVQDAVADVALDLYVGPPDSQIQCGPTITCSAQTQACCWHMGNTTKPYECVADVTSCNGTYDVPMTCSTPDNCASQGNPSYSCCATGGNFGMGQCEDYDVATVVACKSSCDPVTDYQVGCSVKSQNCTDTTQTCVVSKCTVPDDTFCE